MTSVSRALRYLGRGLADKLGEIVSAADYGAKDDFMADDSAAEAAAMVKAKAGRSWLRSLDMHKSVGRGIKVFKKVYGIKDQAAVVSIAFADDGTEPVTQVLALQSESDIGTYGDRDGVGLNVNAKAPPAQVVTASTTFTANSVSSPDFAAVIAARKLKVGMMIDTGETPKKSAFVRSVNSATNTINTSPWYIVGDSGKATATPANGTQVLVDILTKVWGINVNAELPANAAASGIVNIEAGLVNNKADGIGEGVDAPNLGTKKGGTAFRARGVLAQWVRGFHAIMCDFGVIAEKCGVGMYFTGNAQGALHQADDTAVTVKDCITAFRFQDKDGNTWGEVNGKGRAGVLRWKYGLYRDKDTIGNDTVVCSVYPLTATASVTLPAPGGLNPERVIYLRNPKGSGSTATFLGAMEGGAGSVDVQPGYTVTLYSDGGSWLVLGKNYGG